MITWEQFYDGYLCWSDSTISSRLSQIYDLQNADTAEIVDCCQCIDETLACRLLRKAEKAQLSFTYFRFDRICTLLTGHPVRSFLIAILLPCRPLDRTLGRSFPVPPATCPWHYRMAAFSSSIPAENHEKDSLPLSCGPADCLQGRSSAR